jgi:MOSC domain-containing protein YiiM
MTAGAQPAGAIEAICIAPASHEPIRRVDSAELVAGSGIVGDRYFGAAPQGNPGRNITLVEVEEIERFNRETGGGAPLDGTRRNVVTRGVRLVPLIGAEFTIGGVRLRGVEQCEPCAQLGAALAGNGLAPAQVVKQFAHRAGIRAAVLSNGTIRVGDPVVATRGRMAG